jgi:hypothetical protein
MARICHTGLEDFEGYQSLIRIFSAGLAFEIVSPVEILIEVRRALIF